MASIDATVAGIALPAIGRNFGASLTTLQWVVSAYTLTLAGLLLACRREALSPVLEIQDLF
jgi:MFS family permease